MLTVYGDPNSYQNCTLDARNWRLDGVTYIGSGHPDEPSLSRTLTHELGHALNLGHPTYGSIFVDGNSMMSSTENSYPARHPHYWEKDCVDDTGVSGGRAVKYAYKYFSGGAWSGVQTHPYLTERDMWSGHFWKNPSGALTYAVYHSNGWLNYGYGSSFTGYPNWTPTLPSNLQKLDTFPVLFAPIASATDDMHRMIHTWANSTANYYPPYVRYHHADDFGFTTSSWQYLKYCTSSNCASLEYMRSSYPPSTTWDPYTWQDIFVRLDSLEEKDGGAIVIHPGLHQSDRLKQSVGGTLSSSNTSFPTLPYWEYTGLTDALPGVACAPNRTIFAYNCLLAWVDRGAPSGRVLYTYFRVNSSTNAVEWHDTAWARDLSATAGPVAATYAHGRFWMAWKSSHAPPRLTSTYTSTSYTGWSAIEETTRSKMVGAPSFQSFLNTGKMNLVWTELP